jgi:hypothetical protein
LSFIQALGLEDRVHKVTGYAVGACWQKGVSECGAGLEPAWGGNVTLRAAQLDEAELVLVDCSSYQPVECASVNAMNNGVHFASTTASAGNLHAAEFIKWLAAFFNKEEEAKSIFNTAMSLYEDAQSVNGAGQKVVWVSYEAGGSWNAERFKLSSAIYKQELVTAAAGVNIDGDSVQAEFGENMTKVVDSAGNPSFYLETSRYNGSKADTAAAFLSALTLQSVDVLIDETYQWDAASYTIDTFLSNFGLSNTSLKVLRVDGTLSESNDLDWYESRVAHPHRAVQGLQRVMLPDDSLPKYFFRDIGAGELPDLILASSCATPLPFCDPTVSPSIIPMIAPVDEANVATFTLDDRVAAGECADATDSRESFFDSAVQLTDLPSSAVVQAEDLSDFFSLGYTRSAVELLIDYGTNFKVLTDEISKEQYVLTQCGTEPPSDDEIDSVRARPDNSYLRKNFAIPVRTVIATSTTQLSFIQALGLEDRVHKVTGYAVGACWQTGVSECGAGLEPAWGLLASL